MVRALIAGAVMMALAGCGRPAAEPVRLQVFGDPAEIAAYRELIAAYEQEYPGRKVLLIPVGKQHDHMAKLATGFAAGDPPELFIINFRRYGQFAARGVLEPLGARMSASGDFKEAEFYAPAVEAFRYEGELLCLPQNISSLVVYYNRTLFKRYGVPLPHADWRISEFVDAAVKLTRDTDGDGKKDLYGVGLDPVLIRVAPFIWGTGRDIVDDLHKPTYFTLSQPAQMRALSFVKRLNTFYGVVPPLAAHQAENEESRFARGALGMIFNSRRYTPTLRQIKDLDWDVAPFPVLATPASALHADGYCMASATRDKAAAQAFVAYALSAKGQTLIARSGRTVPSRIAVANSPAFLDPQLPPASARVFLDAIPHLRRTPNVAVWHELEMRADQILEEWFYEPPLPTGGESEGPGAEGADLILQLHQAVQPILTRAAKERESKP